MLISNSFSFHWFSVSTGWWPHPHWRYASIQTASILSFMGEGEGGWGWRRVKLSLEFRRPFLPEPVLTQKKTQPSLPTSFKGPNFNVQLATIFMSQWWNKWYVLIIQDENSWKSRPFGDDSPNRIPSHHSSDVSWSNLSRWNAVIWKGSVAHTWDLWTTGKTGRWW